MLAVCYPLTYYKIGAGFLGAAYVALFAAIYAAIANAGYIWSGLKGKLKAAGGSMARIGVALMLAGILISSSSKDGISSSSANGMSLQINGKGPLTKETDSPMDTCINIRHVPDGVRPRADRYMGAGSGPCK